MIRPNCRQRFTPSDYRFLSASIFKDPEHEALWKFLVADPNHLDQLLDKPEVYRALLELRGCVSVSMPFYFYVLVRQTLLQQKVDDRSLSDYVAALLSDFAVHPRMDIPLEGEPPRRYYAELLQALQQAQGERRFLLAVHIGNRALFEAGMLIHAIEEKERRRAAPGVQFLEDLGTEFFRQAAHQSYADQFGMVALFLTLGQAFHTTRLALNQISDEVVHLSDTSKVDQLLEGL
jgi:hypothetical protein